MNAKPQGNRGFQETVSDNQNRNPVGSYVIFVDIDNPANKDWILEFEGVESAFYLWVNGQEAGYSQNSCSPAEFDISKIEIEHGPGNTVKGRYGFASQTVPRIEPGDTIRLSSMFVGMSPELWSAEKPNFYTCETRLYDNRGIRTEKFIQNYGVRRIEVKGEVMNINGLVAPDRTPHPHFHELKYIYQPLKFALTSDSTIQITTIDSEIIGVGGNDAWGAKTEPQYMVRADRPHHFQFRISIP